MARTLFKVFVYRMQFAAHSTIVAATAAAPAMSLCVQSARVRRAAYTHSTMYSVHKFHNVMFSVVFFTGFNKLSLFHRNDAFHHFIIIRVFAHIIIIVIIW